ncbi:SDR family NAD(P)-dependent oxidoreductase [Synoicihabitans lomoniglobus]|uniref:SDR family NAD(P)-dependent oxidoreductase n=1 Tax=Synoicihabitans lomoniglobus TaxID=2909285 RepID=A0AAF0A247_9BACT|nr:SDR family NAD(P)-dependent oxidoreductase [Opitutaceae bacterium LMO-M01]WED65707.1 SDR family NAD(P)-dependent oxidoreductase [Opitutaceae bacterium LMO-M01]
MSTPPDELPDAIAVIGLAVRFPGANSVEAFWDNLRAGRESLTALSDDALRAAGVDPAMIANPAYVRSNGVLADADQFDAAFFGMTPREAALTDPQHRVFLELAWTALERAGYDSTRVSGPVGVFAGAGMSTYLLRNLLPNRDVVESAGEMALLLGNNKDFVPTRTSYKLDLRGPSINVNTACSTSLVATHLACQSLLDHHCDMALAGGVSVQVPQEQGYLYTEGGIGSSDGHCRAFDTDASGTVSGNGCGIVVLRRLADAIADGDPIHAVIRGSAVNNDGADKAGFTAPSITGQSQVIAEAQAVAEVDPTEISYVEAHGTGTPLGDPIEVAALCEAFEGVPTGACALGSVKTNFGHLDEAAGLAGLAKTILALQHRELPASLHFSTPNSRIDFPNTPFRVNASLGPWTVPAGRRRIAGVSSFGIGGTNAHVVVAEAPEPSPSSPARGAQLLVLSATTATALDRARENLAVWLEDNSSVNLADVAYTLAQGRRAFTHRTAITAHGSAEAVRQLRAAQPQTASSAPPPQVWIFSGQGSPYVGMLAGLYAAEPVVRDTIDQCADLLREPLGCDLREILTPDAPLAAERLRDTALAQPIVFVADYALAQLWLSRGGEPAVMIGHSLGEYVAACVAGVFTLEDALKLVTARGALMAAQSAGAMLAVGLSAEAAMDQARDQARDQAVDLAAVNAPDSCVLSGATETIDRLASSFTAQGVATTRLDTSHAFHSAMMEPMLTTFAARVRTVTLHPPQRRIISGVTGQDMTAADAIDPAYWTRHVREPVRFAAAVNTAATSTRHPLWLEVGPGRGLASMVKRCLKSVDSTRVLTSTRHAAETTDDYTHLLSTLGSMWCAGAQVNWPAWFSDQSRQRLVLPTYPFERERHWIEAPAKTSATTDFHLARMTGTLEALETKLRADPALVAHPAYPAFSAAVTPWCAAQVFRYISSALPPLTLGQSTTRTEIARALRIAPAFEKCLDFLLNLLVSEGYLDRLADEALRWQRIAADPVSSDDLRTRFPEFQGIVRLVEHCTAHYAEALSGDVPAITVLYPEGSAELLESTASENAPHTDKRVYLQLLRHAIEGKLATQPPGKPLRILEVGIGDGLLAGELAPALKDRGVDYVATDLSRAFVAKAERKATAAGLDFLSFAVLDISRDPVAQGFNAGEFDFIVGLDVVHATPRLRETLRQLRTLLAPGGCFGIVEKVRSECWVDLVWGLAEGWWYFADTEIRPLTPLLSAAGWESVLRGFDFESIAVFPRTKEARTTTDYALLLAENPTTPPVDVSNWFYAVETQRRTAVTSTNATHACDGADGLPALIALARQLGADGTDQTLELRTDESPEQLMLLGALRTIRREYPQITTRHVLAAGEALSTTVRPVQPDTNSGFVRRAGGVYLITGGFGSMGRVFARELVRELQAHVILLGRHIDGPEQVAFVAELESLGGTVLARTGDVTDLAALENVVDAVRTQFGPIRGVIHTAGVYGQGLIRGRHADDIATTLAPKVTGTRNLARVFAHESLDFFILCSSLASVAPEPGQVDYATANAFLDAFALEHYQKTGTPTLSIGWGVWQELGMMDHDALPRVQKDAVRTEILSHGWNRIGASLWRHVLECGAPHRHLLISPTPVELPTTPLHPLFKSRHEDEAGRVCFNVRLDPAQHWVVDEHRLDGLALLPGTGFLELARAAFMEQTGATAVELSEVYFLSPLTWADNQPREVQVVLHGTSFIVLSRLADDAWMEHTRGDIRVANTPAATAIKFPMDKFVAEPPTAEAVRFGPRWHCLKSVAFDDTGAGVAEIALPEAYVSDLPDYALHPALFDMAIGFITLRHGLPDSLPFCYRRLVVHRPLPVRFRSEVRVVTRTDDGLELAATLWDEQDHLLVEVEGYRLRRRAEPAKATPADQARLVIRPGSSAAPWNVVPAHRVPPGNGEVEIEIAAAGLNFIEVLYANGMLPTTPELEHRFGLECAGRVVRVGAQVAGVAVGDEVIAYANGCFASYVTVPTGAISPRPSGLSPAAAVTLPGAYATAHYALVTQGRLRRGEKVLIHAAAGGVGLAAVHIARHLGAEVFATAGSDAKRNFLRDLGVVHVMDSRSLAFAAEVQQLTDGRGVDVVLNSLGGDFLRASLDLVAPRGRFIELGKRDLLGGSSLDLAPFARIISFIVIDVGPDLPEFETIWHEVCAHFADGTYPALPHKTFPLADAAPAFDYMARARHIGKVVLLPGDPAALLAAARELPPAGRSRAAILGLPEVSSPKEVSPPARVMPVAPDASHSTTPTNDIERTIAAIWEELLGVKPVGIDDDFFALRGDSLLAAQVMARIQSALAVKLPLSSIFDRPTVSGLAARVQSLRRNVPDSLADDEEEGDL